MDRNELPLEPCHHRVPSCSSKMTIEPTVHLAQTVHLSCTNTNTISKWTEMRFVVPHVALGFHWISKMIFELWYVQRKPYNYLASRLAYLQTDRNELPPKPRHLGVPSGASKMISEPMVGLVQTVHLSYIKISTISKRIKTSIHLSLVT
jgi:hypothetical protein